MVKYSKQENCIGGYKTMKEEKIFILQELKKKLTLKDKILLHFFKNYTYRIYKKGMEKGFLWKY